MAELKTDVDNLVTDITVNAIKDFKIDMGNYFQTVVMKSQNEQISMFAQSQNSTKHANQIAANAI
eukprot:2433601-Ditylum_brightwellii.AAC.1